MAKNPTFKGSYDHRITLWDIRQDGTKSVHEFNHEKPVERILFLDPQQDLLASAGETVVKLWNIRAGKLMHQIEFMHRKTVNNGQIFKTN
jgi:WD40 repeat protein